MSLRDQPDSHKIIVPLVAGLNIIKAYDPNSGGVGGTGKDRLSLPEWWVTKPSFNPECDYDRGTDRFLVAHWDAMAEDTLDHTGPNEAEPWRAFEVTQWRSKVGGLVALPVEGWDSETNTSTGRPRLVGSQPFLPRAVDFRTGLLASSCPFDEGGGEGPPDPPDPPDPEPIECDPEIVNRVPLGMSYVYHDIYTAPIFDTVVGYNGNTVGYPEGWYDYPQTEGASYEASFITPGNSTVAQGWAVPFLALLTPDFREIPDEAFPLTIGSTGLVGVAGKPLTGTQTVQVTGNNLLVVSAVTQTNRESLFVLIQSRIGMEVAGDISVMRVQVLFNGADGETYEGSALMRMHQDDDTWDTTNADWCET